MTLLLSSRLGGDCHFLIADAMVSAPSQQGLVESPWVDFSAARTGSNLPVAYQSKIGHYGQFAIGYTGSVKWGTDAVSTVSQMHIGQSPTRDRVLGTLATASRISWEDGYPVAFIVHHHVARGKLGRFYVGREAGTVEAIAIDDFALGSGEAFANRVLNLETKDVAPIADPPDNNSKIGLRFSGFCSALMSGEIAGFHAASSSVGGFLEAHVPSLDTNDIPSFERLLQGTTMLWPAIDLSTISIEDDDIQLPEADILVPYFPETLITVQSDGDCTVIVRLTSYANDGGGLAWYAKSWYAGPADGSLSTAQLARRALDISTNLRRAPAGQTLVYTGKHAFAFMNEWTSGTAGELDPIMELLVCGHPVGEAGVRFTVKIGDFYRTEVLAKARRHYPTKRCELYQIYPTPPSYYQLGKG